MADRLVLESQQAGDGVELAADLALDQDGELCLVTTFEGGSTVSVWLSKDQARRLQETILEALRRG